VRHARNGSITRVGLVDPIATAVIVIVIVLTSLIFIVAVVMLINKSVTVMQDQ
jgi:hypothetical protein